MKNFFDEALGLFLIIGMILLVIFGVSFVVCSPILAIGWVLLQLL